MSALASAPEPMASRIDVRCSDTERDVWRWAAQRAGVTVSELARRLLNAHAANEIAGSR